MGLDWFCKEAPNVVSSAFSYLNAPFGGEIGHVSANKLLDRSRVLRSGGFADVHPGGSLPGSVFNAVGSRISSSNLEPAISAASLAEPPLGPAYL